MPKTIGQDKIICLARLLEIDYTVEVKHWILVTILVLAAFLRLWQLGNIPLGLSNDEAGNTYSAYSIWKTGYDVSGKFLPLSFNLDNAFSPVYIYADAPFVGLLGLSAFAARLPFALLGIACIPLMYWLTELIYKKERVSLLAAGLLAISPWHIVVSRVAIDSDFSLFFFLLGLCLFIYYRKSKGILLSFVPFVLGFYSYHATKLFFIPMFPLLLWYYRKDLFSNRKAAGILLAGVVLLFASFVFVARTQSVGRQGIFFWNDTNQASAVVNHEREYTTGIALGPLFSNKLAFFGTAIRNNYLEAFSPEFLFLYGEPSGLKRMFSLLTSGELYVIEAVFLLMGLYVLFKERLAKLPLLLLLLAPLPSAFILEQSYVNRSIMMVPFLVILVALGINHGYKLAMQRHRHIAYSILVTVVLAYLILFGQFCYVYFFRFPLYSADAWFAQDREIAGYVTAHHREYPHIYINHAGSMFLLQYGIYNHIEPKLIQTAWKAYPHATIGNVSFVENHCNPETELGFYHYPKGSLLIAPGDCYYSGSPHDVIRDKGEYANVLWRIFIIP